MFLVHTPARVKLLSNLARTATPVIYDALLRPLTADEAVRKHIEQAIEQAKGATADDRRLMLEYADQYLHGATQAPSDAGQRCLYSQAIHIVDAGRNHVRRTQRWHPLRKVAA